MSPTSKNRFGVASAALLLGFSLTPASQTLAIDGSEMLDCWIAADLGYIDWADRDFDETTEDATVNQSHGSSHPPAPGGSDDTQFQCTWIVPPDYPGSPGSTPTVTIMGWLDDTNDCGSTCGATVGRVTLEVCARPIATGDWVTGPWDCGSSGYISFTPSGGGDCPGGQTCYHEDLVQTLTLSATGTAGDWDPGDLIFIRIRRIQSAANDVDENFHVATVRLDYPTS